VRSTFLPALLTAATLGAGLVAAVPESSTAAPPPASASTPPAPRTVVAPAGTVTGEPVAVSGRVPRRAKPQVRLERLVGRAWVKVALGRTTARSYTFRFGAPEATSTYRVTAVLKRGKPGRTPGKPRKPSRPKRWASAPEVVAVTPQQGTVTVPSATQAQTVLPASVAFTPVRPGRPVELQAQAAGGAWTTVATGTQDAHGRTVFTVEPSATTSYRAVAGGWGGAVPAASATSAIEVLPPREEPWVTGYYAGWFWEGNYRPTDVDFDAMTHFVFGRVTPGGGGAFGGAPGEVMNAGGNSQDPSPWAPYAPGSVEDWMVREAHAHGTEALLMLGGDREAGGGFVASTADGVRARFVENIVDYLVAHDYDGVDLDWENCIGGQAWECGVDITEAEASRRLKALILELRAEMATRPRYADDPGLITFPGYALNLNDLQPGGRAKQWQADVARSVDQFNLMSYGIGTTWNKDSWKSWFSGALDGESRENGTPVSIDSSVEVYERTGVPRSRIGMGIGFYGIYFGPMITGPRQRTDPDPVTGFPGNDIYETNDVTLAYSELDEMGYLDHGELRWDEEASSSYISYLDEPDIEGGFVPESDPNRNAAGFLSFEDERSIAAKGDYTRETGLGGTILWVLNYGALPDHSNPLLDQVKESFLGR
jgi:chitinase